MNAKYSFTYELFVPQIHGKWNWEIILLGYLGSQRRDSDPIWNGGIIKGGYLEKVKPNLNTKE